MAHVEDVRMFNTKTNEVRFFPPAYANSNRAKIVGWIVQDVKSTVTVNIKEHDEAGPQGSFSLIDKLEAMPVEIVTPEPIKATAPKETKPAVTKKRTRKKTK